MKNLTLVPFICLFLLFVVVDVYGKRKDWLLNEVQDPVTLNVTKSGSVLELRNGLISRKFALVPDFATIDFRNGK